MDRFLYKPTIKTLDDFPEHSESKVFEKAEVAFIHAEEEDQEEDRIKAVEKKLIKNLKWIAGKNQTKTIVLHSFAHLSESKADPGFTKEFFDRVEIRLKNTGYEVFQTPFGYFLDLEVNAPGHSLARVFKSL
jgi:hypothetical protein